MTESLLYKTPSPVTTKRQSSSISVSQPGVGRAERAVSERVQRVHKNWPELHGERTRSGSLGNSGDFLKNLKEEAESIDSTMGFRELERVRSILYPANGSILQRSSNKTLI
jgi:hypothetical protein